MKTQMIAAVCSIVASLAICLSANAQDNDLDQTLQKGVFNDIEIVRKRVDTIAEQIGQNEEQTTILYELGLIRKHLESINSGIKPDCEGGSPKCDTELHKKLGELVTALGTVANTVRREQLAWIKEPVVECNPTHTGDCQTRADSFCQKLNLHRAAHFRLVPDSGDRRQVVDLACIDQ